MLQKVFRLRTCEDTVFANRTRPCLLYQIKRCSGPCTGEIPLTDYGQLVEDARQFLSGKSKSVQDHLATDMNAAAERLDFEQAARFRDRLSALALIQSGERFDLLLTDIVMPEMDGIELAQKASVIDPNLRVMFITGFSAVTLRAGQALPNAKVLSKPFHLKDLVLEVDRVFEVGSMSGLS